jgi:hypothetical protein
MGLRAQASNTKDFGAGGKIELPHSGWRNRRRGTSFTMIGISGISARSSSHGLFAQSCHCDQCLRLPRWSYNADQHLIRESNMYAEHSTNQTKVILITGGETYGASVSRTKEVRVAFWKHATLTTRILAIVAIIVNPERGFYFGVRVVNDRSAVLCTILRPAFHPRGCLLTASQRPKNSVAHIPKIRVPHGAR